MSYRDLPTADSLAREQAILREVAAGRYPEWLHPISWVPVDVRLDDGRLLQIRVSPDYFSLGTSEDFVRMPVRPATAQAIANAFSAVLPTAFLVDKIYQSKQEHPRSAPMQNENRNSSSYFPTTKDMAAIIEHNRRIENYRRSQGIAPGVTRLIAGHKKDIVIGNTLANNPNKVVIYGWWPSPSDPNTRVQPLSSIHSNGYVDYSHGFRLISKLALLDGNQINLATSMRTVPGLVSSSGVIREGGTAYSVPASYASILPSAPLPVEGIAGDGNFLVDPLAPPVVVASGTSSSSVGPTIFVIGLVAAGLWFVSKRQWLKAAVVLPLIPP